MRNITLIILFFLMCGCGYTSVYKNLGNQDFQIAVVEMQGDREMNNLIKNELNLYSNKNSINKFDLEIKTKYEKNQLTKDSAGLVTDYELTTSSTFTIYFNEKSKKITFDENINIKNQTDKFEQDLYEKNIKRNFASSIRGKLISEILAIK